MKDDADVNSNLIQYSDDTFIFCSRRTFSERKLHLEKSIVKLIIFSKKILLNINERRTKFIIFGTPKKNKIEKLVVNRCTVLKKKVVKHLGGHIDCNFFSLKK